MSPDPIYLRLSPVISPPNEQYGTQLTSGGYGGWTWPEGQPTEGQLMIGGLALRASQGVYTSAIVPIGTNQLGVPDQYIAGTEWTWITGLDTNSNYFTNRPGYPITMAWRAAGANEPVLANWQNLGGSSGPRAHFAEIAITPGAPSVQVSQGDIIVTGATFTSPNITTTGAGYIFGIMGYNCSGPADGASASFSFEADVETTHILSQGFQYSSFGGYSIFFYRYVSGAGTYNMAFTRSAAPRAGSDYSFILGYWPAAAATPGFPG